MDILKDFTSQYRAAAQTKLSLQDFFDLCKTEPLAYATAAERMVAAIGEPVLLDTSADARLSIIHQNRTIPIYKAFEDFYGIETAIEKIVGFFKHAAQGLEERKQVLYLLGPVGSSKSSIAERLKALMEVYPIYVLAYEGKTLEVSPIFESPLGLFDPAKYAQSLEDNYGINARYLKGLMSPWAIKRLDEAGGDLGKFCVVRLLPSRMRQIGVMKTEPSDANNSDITTLIGKTNMRMLEHFSQHDPDSYSFSGALNRTTQGLMEMVEIFKSPIQLLHPLLTATQEGNYVGSEAIGAMPYHGVILSHSNESEWETFKNNKQNEAFIDRICTIKIPYNLQSDEEIKIYEKMLAESALRDAPIAPKTLDILAQFSVLSRLIEHENSTYASKRAVYNGEDVKNSDPKAKSIQEYRDTAGVNEGMTGISTRFAFKILSKTFSRDIAETSADPVLLIDILNTAIVAEEFPKERQDKLKDFIKTTLVPKYLEYLGKEIRGAYLENADDYGQTLFDKYIDYSDHWIGEKSYKDSNTGTMLDRELLNKELEAIEKAAGIANPRDFRNEIVMFSLRHRAQHNGANPKWTSYNKLKEVIEQRIFSTLDSMLPVISFGSKRTTEEEEKHTHFIERMRERGYTPRQSQRVIEYYLRMQKAS